MSLQTSTEDWNLLAQFCQAYRALSDNLMNEVAMHRAQAQMLCHLIGQQGMTQTEIGEQLAVQGATITNMLKRMEEAGLVTRQRDREDNRLVRVYLTEAGIDKERSVVEQFLKVETAIFAGLSEEDRTTLRQLLHRMLDNMNRKE